MNKTILKKIARIIQKLSGIESVLNKQKMILREIQDLRRKTSLLEFAHIDEEKLRDSYKFKLFHQLIPLLSPMDISGAEYRRYGRNYDGGYVMLKDFSSRDTDAAYSFGIGGDVTWDEEIAALGIPVYMYDHTIKKLPKTNPLFHFFREGVTGNPDEKGLDTLSNFLRRNGHQESSRLLLKMDIEGYEWGVLDETPSSVIGQFTQILLELHGLNTSSSEEKVSKILAVLNKINKTHQSIHVHANGQTPVDYLGELTLPNDLEVTYIRRIDYADKFIPNARKFPTSIDQSTSRYLPDIPLGRFSVAEQVPQNGASL